MKLLETAKAKLKDNYLLIRLFWSIKRFFYQTFLKTDIAPAMTSNPLLKWPRNFKCVCGSGKKFKVCHLNDLARKVTIEDAIAINLKLDKHRA